jgi:hypothetical protein
VSIARRTAYRRVKFTWRRKRRTDDIDSVVVVLLSFSNEKPLASDSWKQTRLGSFESRGCVQDLADLVTSWERRFIHDAGGSE